MLTKFVLPTAIILGLITSFYQLRKTRDRSFLPSLLIFIVPFVVDILSGELDIPADRRLIPVKLAFIAAGWIAWTIPYLKRK